MFANTDENILHKRKNMTWGNINVFIYSYLFWYSDNTERDDISRLYISKVVIQYVGSKSNPKVSAI